MDTKTVFEIIAMALKAIQEAVKVFRMDVDEMLEDLKTNPRPVDPSLKDKLKDMDV